MADKNLLEQMLERLVNDDKQKAEELFHEYVVSKSREIYETLIESEMDDDEKDEEEVDESSEKDEDEDDLDENFEEIAYEADKEGPMGDMGDDLEGELDAGEMGPEEDDEFADKDPEELFQDLDSIVGELQAKFDAMNGDDAMGGDDMGDMGGDDEMKDEFDLATVREYVDKVPAGHGAEKKGQAEKADGSASGLKFQKNDMGGTSANILGGKNGQDGGYPGAGSTVKGSSLLKGNPQLQDGGNVNTPGAKNGNAFSKKEPGHGAEKAGSKESADKGAAGLFRGRR